MNEEETQVETEEVVPTAISEPSQEDPVKEELDRIESAKRSKLEKLQYTKERVEKQIADELRATGQETVEEKDKPLTWRDLEAYESQKAQATAITLADSIEDANEQKLVKHYLENTIKPSGDPQTDLRNARLMANAVKNRQLAEEAARITNVRTAPSAPAAPARQTGTEPELSREDEAVMRGFGLTKEEAAKALQS